MEEGQLSPDLDLEVAAVALLGPVMYRNLLRLTGGQPPDNLVDVMVSTFWKAYGVPPRRRPARALLLRPPKS